MYTRQDLRQPLESIVIAPILTFKYLGHTKRDDGTFASYTIGVTSSHNGRVEALEIEPNHLASAQSMKRLLLGRCMFYSSTQKKHTETIAAMFNAQDAEAERGSCLD